MGQVSEDDNPAGIRRGIHVATEAEDDRLGAVEATAADEVEDLHALVAASGSLRLRSAQKDA